jgi:hypothetical protein
MNVDTNRGPIGIIVGPVVRAKLLRRSRQVCVIDDWVCNVSENPDEGVLRSLYDTKVKR